MKNIITLEALSEIGNGLGKGVRVAFCSSDANDFEVLRKEDFISFKAIKKEITDGCQYRVFRIDTLNDLMCVYVTSDGCQTAHCERCGR